MTLILGRFQPLHKGHLKVIEDAFLDDKEIIIAIGSSDKVGEKLNPFSAEERKKMISSVLSARGIPAKVIFVPDIDCDERYVGHVEKIVGRKIHKVITENTNTVALFKAAMYDVHTTPRYYGVSATEIRRLIVTGGDWQSCVPKEVAGIIKKIKGVERIKKIYSD